MSPKTIGWMVVIALAATPLIAADASAKSDDAFFEQLGKPGRPVDLERLSELLFSVASTLDGARSTVGLLQGGLPARELTSPDARRQVAARYDQYAQAVIQFKAAVSDLLDAPKSRRLLLAVLMDGHRSCWYLDVFQQMLEAYGVPASELMSIVPSTDACGRFRGAALHPRVVELLDSELDKAEEYAIELADLKEDMEALEGLLDDLEEIDAGD